MADTPRDRGRGRPRGYLGRFLAWLGRLRRSYVVVIALGLVVGLIAAPLVPSEPRVDGKVAVVSIQGGIDGASAAEVSDKLEQARTDSSVEAVVVVARSGGGGSISSAELYMEVKRTAQQKPVIASADVALSGAYYAIAPADAIYAKPSSLVGSVGVIGRLPQEVEPLEGFFITSGPDKLTGGSQRDAFYRAEAAQRAFVNAVMTSRGDRLEISREKVETAEIFVGAEAVQNGMADRLGSQEAAIDRAAQEAGLDSYRVVRYDDDGDTTQFVTRAAYVASDAPPSEKTMLEPSYFLGPSDEEPSTVTFAMLPPSVIGDLDPEDPATVANGSGATEPAERATATDGTAAPANATADGAEVTADGA